MKIVLATILAIVSTVVSAQPAPQIVPALMFHRVNPAVDPSEYAVHPERFKEYIEVLAVNGFTTVTASELADFMLGKIALPANSVALTFDDGWKDSLIAAELLREKKMKATFYVLSGTFEDPQYLNEADVLALSTDFEIGAHSHTHFVKWAEKLNALSEQLMIAEMIYSRTLLSEITKKPVLSYAWPYGHHTQNTVAAAKNNGFTSTMMAWGNGGNSAGSSTMSVKRINIDGRCTSAQFIRMVSTGNAEDCK